MLGVLEKMVDIIENKPEDIKLLVVKEFNYCQEDDTSIEYRFNSYCTRLISSVNNEMFVIHTPNIYRKLFDKDGQNLDMDGKLFLLINNNNVEEYEYVGLVKRLQEIIHVTYIKNVKLYSMDSKKLYTYREEEN